MNVIQVALDRLYLDPNNYRLREIGRASCRERV